MYLVNNSDILWQSVSAWRPHPLDVILELGDLPYSIKNYIYMCIYMYLYM